jgi:hypothetical protein
MRHERMLQIVTGSKRTCSVHPDAYARMVVRAAAGEDRDLRLCERCLDRLHAELRIYFGDAR